MKNIVVTGDIATGVCTSHQTPQAVTGNAVSTCPTIQAGGIPITRDTNVIQFSCGHTGICKSSSKILIAGLAPMLNGDSVLPLSGSVTATIVATNNLIVQSE